MRALDIRHSYIFAFPIEHDLATIGIGKGESTPRTHRIAMLLRGIYLNRNRALPILIQEILNRVDVVLPHVAQSTTVIIPIPPERGVDAMRTVRFIRCRAQPHIEITLFWNRTDERRLGKE